MRQCTATVGTHLSRGGGSLEIAPVEEIFERSVLDLHDDLAVAVTRLRHPERAAIETFIEETKSGTIEEQNLRGFTSLAEVPRAGIIGDGWAVQSGWNVDVPVDVVDRQHTARDRQRHGLAWAGFLRGPGTVRATSHDFDSLLPIRDQHTGEQ
jgi:hypothetical protein